MRHFNFLVITLLLGTVSVAGHAYEDTSDEGVDYVFAWPFIDISDMAPRGGTTTGPKPDAVTEPTEAWQQLRADGLDKTERDRRAILAMAGAYRVSFDFLETVGFAPGFEPAKPYRSWATEYVYVLADEPEFISLQHILVMVIEEEDGELSDPMVTKHWRQDWRYEDTDLHEHVGHGIWERTTLDENRVEGSWTQAVFQVDDSPRYESHGRWRHFPTHSVWQGGETRRPLPRREFSVRDDYDLLIGSNRHTILPTGWTHEQDNLKALIEDSGELDPDQPFLARETGVNRYQRVEGFDFGAGDEYWRATADFWAMVRNSWAQHFEAHDRLQLTSEVDGQSMMMTLFGLAGEIADGRDFDDRELETRIDRLFETHVEALPASD
ncbi:DUF6607 family protein [Wenzhouxiangella sp. EGI_FJ10409]|uniref:DUF6607 family protein n=1 Tax=Wenzhouxiangella sp. EGI_FJ10409 TaxID=3243767 RepID=UPI0035DC9FED